MRLANWLEEAFGSPTRVAVLRLLDRTHPTEYTLREIARALGKGPSSALVAINALESLGLVQSRRLGNSNGYLLRSTGVRPLLAEIFASERKLESLAVRAIVRATPKGVSSFLFGSAARRTQTAGSDLDILIIAKEKANAEQAAEEIRGALSRIGFLRPQTFAIGQFDAKQRRTEPWFEHAKQDARRVAGPALETWL